MRNEPTLYTMLLEASIKCNILSSACGSSLMLQLQKQLLLFAFVNQSKIEFDLRGELVAFLHHFPRATRSIRVG